MAVSDPAGPDLDLEAELISVPDRVAAEIRERIRYGRLAPGQRLIEADLIGQLGVSRNTVRSAFNQLAAEGVITVERNRGAHVRVLDLEGIRQLYELRSTLEGRAAALTASRIDEPRCREAIQDLATHNDEFLGGGAFAEYWSHNARLHRVVLAHCGNEMIRKMAEQARTLTHHYHLQAAGQGDPEKPVSISHACARHQQLLTAILVGDASQAEASMRRHIEETGESIIEFMTRTAWKK
jgi:DNA-binding GntR family transcriptional regulator